MTCVIDMQSIEEVIFLCSFLKELAPFSCSLSHILISASRFRRLTDRQLCHNVFIIETFLPVSEKRAHSCRQRQIVSKDRVQETDSWYAVRKKQAYIPDLF